MIKNKDFVEVPRKDPTQPKSRKSLDPSLLKRFLHIKDPDLDGQKVDLDLLDDLLTNSDIDSEMDKVSIFYALLLNTAAYADERHENEKANLKKIFGKLDEEARDGTTMGRPTDAKVKAWIEAHPIYQKCLRRINKYARQAARLEGDARAFEMKSRMLQTRSANTRKMLGDIPEPNSTSSAKTFNTKKKKIKKKIKGDA